MLPQRIPSRSKPIEGPLILFGAGGYGKVVLDAALTAGLKVAYLVDDEPPCAQCFGIPVVASRVRCWQALSHFRFLVSIGDNARRQVVFANLLDRGGTPVNILHPAAVISTTVHLGRGIVACAGVVINAQASIGDNCILNTAASVDHDCQVRDHVHLCPGVRLAGGVTIGPHCMIGTGACVLPGVRVGRGSIVGAGAVVNRDLPEGVVAYGVPAKVKRTRNTKGL